jgi:ethanolamine ammonia-lyase small subunit
LVCVDGQTVAQELEASDMAESDPQAPPASLTPTTPALRSYTPARVSLSTTGSSLTTAVALDFALDFAQARDAVHSALDVAPLLDALHARNLAAICVHSAASTRTEYLRRPDLGRTLSPDSSTLLQAPTSHLGPRASNLTIILADGLSALATQTHTIPLLDTLLPLLSLDDPAPVWSLTPIVLATQARVALADPIGLALHADAAVILIGERPGLSSPDSLGAYITWSPRPGRTDAERNCISNIRPPLPGQAGLDYSTAAAKIAWYLTQARRLGLTGVSLREPDAALLPSPPDSKLE